MSDIDKAHARSSLPGRLRRNRAAKAFVYLGGLGTIACILAIVLFLLIEAIPLFGGASVDSPVAVESKRPLLTMATDRFQITLLGLDEDGQLWDYKLVDGSSKKHGRLEGLGANEKIREAKAVGRSFLIQTDAERLAVLPFAFETSYSASDRQVSIELGDVQWWEPDPERTPLTAAAVTEVGEGGFTIAYQRGSQPVHLTRILIEVNEFTEEEEVEKSEFEIEVGLPLSFLNLESEGGNLIAVDEQGRIHWWSLEEEEATKRQLLDTGFGKPSCVSFLQADRSLILGNADGALRQFFRVRDSSGEETIREIRSFPPMDSGIQQIVRSTRNKAFLVSTKEGGLGLYYGTTGNRDWMGNPGLGTIQSIALAPKGNGILVSGQSGTSLLALENPHPEVSVQILLGKVWYENYPEPTYTWQSTGGTDDFETKISLIPLIFGTIKGTFFSMLLAIPLALLAALYAALFVHPKVRRIVKPAIEIMAAIPSVILGFLCAIYMAPILETGFGGFVLLPLTLPLFMILGSIALTRIPSHTMSRLPKGSEILILGAILVACILTTFLMGTFVETWFFGGDAPKWITQVLGLPYEQRNAIVIAMGMSFAVIPLIFSISEDAISNVPRSLVSGSLALGANKWETAIRVILPTASPGIFSAIMIGLGRAVGETMIVLMAAGNTPIMDWNPFNGFRTLSANIAVEIPEAPHEGTLYRTLFLAAILLFLMTFVLNTIAEVVRQRLRSRYANI